MASFDRAQAQPANIFLTLDGTVKVGDLGLGRMFSADTVQAFSKVWSVMTVALVPLGRPALCLRAWMPPLTVCRCRRGPATGGHTAVHEPGGAQRQGLRIQV